METALLILAVILAAAAYGVYKILTMPMDFSIAPRMMAEMDAAMGLYPACPLLRTETAPVMRDVTPRQTEDDARRQREAFLKANPDIAAELAKRHLTQGVQPRRIADMRVIH